MLLNRLPSSSVRVFPFGRRFSYLPDSCFGAASLLAQRRLLCPAVSVDDPVFLLLSESAKRHDARHYD